MLLLIYLLKILINFEFLLMKETKELSNTKMQFSIFCCSKKNKLSESLLKILGSKSII